MQNDGVRRRRDVVGVIVVGCCASVILFVGAMREAYLIEQGSTTWFEEQCPAVETEQPYDARCARELLENRGVTGRGLPALIGSLIVGAAAMIAIFRRLRSSALEAALAIAFAAAWTWILVWNITEGRRLVSTGFV